MQVATAASLSQGPESRRSTPAPQRSSRARSASNQAPQVGVSSSAAAVPRSAAFCAPCPCFGAPSVSEDDEHATVKVAAARRAARVFVMVRVRRPGLRTGCAESSPPRATLLSAARRARHRAAGVGHAAALGLQVAVPAHAKVHGAATDVRAAPGGARGAVVGQSVARLRLVLLGSRTGRAREALGGDAEREAIRRFAPCRVRIAAHRAVRQELLTAGEAAFGASNELSLGHAGSLGADDGARAGADERGRGRRSVDVGSLALLRGARDEEGRNQ